MKNLETTAFIFDVDGTLVYTENIYAELILQYLKYHGVIMPEEQYYAQFSGKSFHFVFEYANKILSFQNKPLIEIPQAIQIIDRIYYEKIQLEGLKRTKGSLEMIQQLSQNQVQRAIASNAPKHVIEQNLAASSHIHHFQDQHIFSAYQFQKWKPDPIVFQAAFESLNTNQIERVFILEDSNSGLEAITNFKTNNPQIEVVGIFIDNGHNSSLKQKLPESINHSLDNLIDCLELI